MSAHELSTPVFSELTDAESWVVLSRNHIGRLAFLNERRVDIEPVSYAASPSWIFMRSAEGSKLEALAHTPYVAFEVDEVDSPFDWRSVVARGTIYVMSDGQRYVDQETVDRAILALRSFIPETLTVNDPTPFRHTVYGVHVDLITGRCAELAPRGSSGVSNEQTRSPHRRTPDGF